jgi:hypothetical protein
VSGCPPDYDGRLALASADLARLERRLRALSAAASASQRATVMTTLGRLAEVSASAAGREQQALPPIADHALADALVVLGQDAVESLATHPDERTLTSMIETLQEAFQATL